MNQELLFELISIVVSLLAQIAVSSYMIFSTLSDNINLLLNNTIGRCIIEYFLAPLFVLWATDHILRITYKWNRKRRLKKYSKDVSSMADYGNEYTAIATNTYLHQNYFVIKTIDLEEHYIVPFPESYREELIENNFEIVFDTNKNQKLEKELHALIQTYYGNAINYGGKNLTISELITVISEETANDFILQIKDGKVRFNKSLFGVYDIIESDGHCYIKLYQSDYFTFKCMRKLFCSLMSMDCIDTTPFKDKPLTVAKLRPFLNSIGLGGFIIIDRGKGDELVLALRGSNCDSGNYWHFSFDETFTIDDQYNEVPDLYGCLRRALAEELGILLVEQEKCLPESQLSIVDVGLIQTPAPDNRYEIEVCAFARVCLSDNYKFDDFIRGYRFAKDAELETRCLDFVPLKNLDDFTKKHTMSPEALSLASLLSTKNGRG